ncbi:MAG: twin-arginine translocase subunit TatC [Halobacteriales archaeon]
MSEEGGLVDEDTRRAISAGRATVGEMLSAAKHDLRRVFLVFVVGLLVTIVAMREWIWPVLKADLLARGAKVFAITPFDVILLQAKIGLFVGVVLSIPMLLYYARDPLKARGWYPQEGVANWKLAGIAVLAVLLFVGGVLYSYNVFFPVMFRFLVDNAEAAELLPNYSIVYWTQFIFVLALSFGFAAQLPLVVTALSYAGIVPYEAFRDNWKYAVLGMFGFGALFSPPDPFTQAMWAGPLVALYGVSLYFARLAVAFKRGGETGEMRASVRGNANRIAAGAVLAGGLAWWFLTSGVAIVNDAVLPRLPAAYRPGAIDPASVTPLAGDAGVQALAAVVGLLAAVALALYYAWPSMEPRDGEFGDPSAIDIEPLDAAGVKAAPPEAFAAMDEEEALAAANAAMDADRAEKARLILDRYDEVEDGEETADAEGDAADDASGAAGPGGAERAAAGFLDDLTEGETDEDDIGGYYTDIRFILSSLRSKAFRIFAVFALTLVGIFTFLYSGGIGAIKADFLGRLPEAARPEEVGIVTLHPVEALVFEVKISTLLGVVATIPLLLYYAWPALKQRGIASGDRNVFFGWAGALAGGLLVGSALGYLVVAPAVISYLVWDALQADMVITYRVSNFFWLVFYTTVGIGLWIDIPVTMVLFHRGGIVSYTAMRDRWRVVTLAVLVGAAVFTPSSIVSMILITIPIMLGYGLGLGFLWLYTFRERRTVRPAVESG